MRLTYEAIDETGKDVADEIEAISAADATETLRGLGLTVTTISEVRRRRVATDSTHTVRGQTRRLKNLSLLARQLAVLIRTGTPLADALREPTMATAGRALGSAGPSRVSTGGASSISRSKAG